MYRNVIVLAAVLTVQVTAFDAIAACTAGNPSGSVIESTPTSAFTNNGDGTVTHTLTGLMWKQCPQGLSGAGCATGTAKSVTWKAALAAAVADTTAGHSDWRLPNRKELESIVERCGFNPTINRTLFPGRPTGPFWSGTSYVVAPTSAWSVEFYTGFTNTSSKTNAGFIHLVRGGRFLDAFDAQSDFVPTAFSFITQTGVARSTLTTSNTIIVAGMNGISPVSIVGGSYAINSTAYTTAAGAVSSGDTVTLRQTSSASYSTMTTTTLTIGGVSGAFNVTTEPPPLLTVIKGGTGSGTVTSIPPGIDCGLDCSESYASPIPVTLTATPAAGSVFMGWLGACIGTGPCDVSVSVATSVSATFAPNTIVPDIDIDGNNNYDALTDGLLIIRYLSGMTGTSLTSSVIGTGSARTTPVEISQYLDNINPLLDVDGNGEANALTDSLMAIRYLFGLRGPSLIAGAVGPGATRTTAVQIEAYIQSLMQ